MLRLFYAALISVVGAGIVHIAVLFLLPQFSDRDAWSSLAEAADFYKAVRINSEAGETPVVRSGDPFFYAAACRFDLDDGAVHVRAPGKIPFWSVSIYDRGGQNIYSFNDRATASGSLDFVVLTSAQMVEIRKQLPEEFERSIFVETAVDEGIVVVRSFVPDLSWRQLASIFLSNLTCSKEKPAYSSGQCRGDGLSRRLSERFAPAASSTGPGFRALVADAGKYDDRSRRPGGGLFSAACRVPRRK